MREIKLTREEEREIDEKLGPDFKKIMNEFAKKLGDLLTGSGKRGNAEPDQTSREAAGLQTLVPGAVIVWNGACGPTAYVVAIRDELGGARLFGTDWGALSVSYVRQDYEPHDVLHAAFSRRDAVVVGHVGAHSRPTLSDIYGMARDALPALSAGRGRGKAEMAAYRAVCGFMDRYSRSVNSPGRQAPTDPERPEDGVRLSEGDILVFHDMRTGLVRAAEIIGVTWEPVWERQYRMALFGVAQDYAVAWDDVMLITPAKLTGMLDTGAAVMLGHADPACTKGAAPLGIDIHPSELDMIALKKEGVLHVYGICDAGVTEPDGFLNLMEVNLKTGKCDTSERHMTRMDIPVLMAHYAAGEAATLSGVWHLGADDTKHRLPYVCGDLRRLRARVRKVIASGQVDDRVLPLVREVLAAIGRSGVNSGKRKYGHNGRKAK